jgi:hypothetical protein
MPRTTRAAIERRQDIAFGVITGALFILAMVALKWVIQ